MFNRTFIIHDNHALDAARKIAASNAQLADKMAEIVIPVCEYIDSKCPACKFYLWFEDQRDYRCSIKGCWEGSKFEEFTIENWMEEIDREREKRTI